MPSQKNVDIPLVYEKFLARLKLNKLINFRNNYSNFKKSIKIIIRWARFDKLQYMHDWIMVGMRNQTTWINKSFTKRKILAVF